jgi:hypothetical protein
MSEFHLECFMSNFSTLAVTKFIAGQHPRARIRNFRWADGHGAVDGGAASGALDFLHVTARDSFCALRTIAWQTFWRVLNVARPVDADLIGDGATNATQATGHIAGDWAFFYRTNSSATWRGCTGWIGNHALQVDPFKARAKLVRCALG